HLCGWHLLRLDAEPGEHLPTHAADAELEPLQIIDRPDLLAEPAAHLRAGVAHDEAMDVERVEGLVDDLSPASDVPPRMLMARIEPERDTGSERQHRRPVGIEVGGRLRTLYRPVSHRVERPEPRGDCTRRMRLDREPAVCRLRDIAREPLRRAEDDVEPAREGRCEPPFELRFCLSDRWLC